MAATEARHALERAQKDREIQDLKDMHAAQIKDLQSKVNERDNPKEKTVETNIETDKNGNPIKKTEKTSKTNNSAFDSNTTYNMKDSNGKVWSVKHDNLEAAKKAGLTQVDASGK